MKKTSLNDWKVYLKWNVLSSAAPYLSNDFVMQSYHFNNEVLSGQKQIQDRWKRVINMTDSRIGDALGQLYVAKYFPPDAKKKADEAKLVQMTATAKVAAAKKVADDAQALQQKEVNKLRAIQDKLMRELLSARNVRVTLEQQRQLALLEESQANTAANTANQAKVWPDIGFKGRNTIRTTEAQRLAAVEYAKRQVLARKPYVWGSEGPNTFDCSGLVYAAYKSAGLSSPGWGRLNAALYFVATKRVPLNALVPGDLLFYSYDGSVQNIHHITIYAGNGMMWEANSKKVGLIYSNMYSIKGLMPSGGRV